MEVMDRIVIGSELEYGAGFRTVRDPQDFQHNFMPEPIEETLYDGKYTDSGLVVMEGVYHGYGIARNGSRLYQDHFHPEYATALATLAITAEAEQEDQEAGFPDGLTQLIAMELGGEEIIRDAFERYEDDQDGRIKIAINKSVTSLLASWGYHINVLGRREVWGKYDLNDPERLYNDPKFKTLGILIATMNLLVGSGGIQGNLEDGFHFVRDEKAMRSNADFSLDTVVTKPVVNLRDRSYAGDAFIRMHITPFSPNISPWAMLMKPGMIALAMTAIEAGIMPDWPFELRKGDLLGLMHQTAEDMTGEKEFEFECGYKIKPIDLLEQVRLAVVKLGERVELSSRLQWVAEEWRICDEAFVTKPSLLRSRADWALRQYLTEQKLEQYSDPDAAGRKGLAHERLRAFHKAYTHLTTRSKGPDVPTTLRASNRWARYMPPRDLVEHYKLNPPANNRSRLVGQVIGTLHGRKELYFRAGNEALVRIGGSLRKLELPGDPRLNDVPGFSGLLQAILDADELTPELDAKLPPADTRDVVDIRGRVKAQAYRRVYSQTGSWLNTTYGKDQTSQR